MGRKGVHFVNFHHFNSEPSAGNLEGKMIKLYKCYSDLNLDPTMPNIQREIFSFTTTCFKLIVLTIMLKLRDRTLQFVLW